MICEYERDDSITMYTICLSMYHLREDVMIKEIKEDIYREDRIERERYREIEDEEDEKRKTRKRKSNRKRELG